MKYHVSLVAISLALMASFSAAAQDNACLIEGSFAIMGKTIHSKDCMQSAPKEATAEFKGSCSKLAATSVAFGGTAGKITYLTTCPKPSQGVCANFLGSKRDAYYYARSASDLKLLPSSCAQAGGHWLTAGSAP